MSTNTTNMMQIVLYNGPRAGVAYTVRKDCHVFYVPLPDDDPTEFLSAMSFTPVSITPLRKGIYRARRIPATGHIVHDDQQRAIFDYAGEC